MSTPALVLQDIRKSYFGNPVLKGVSLHVQPGEIHALVGENGAGKSTLMNILFGMPVIHSTGGYEGEIRIGGVEVRPRTPSDAMRHGVGMVHQEFMLLPGFTVTENIKLNRERTRPNPISSLLRPVLLGPSQALESLDWKRMHREARAALDGIGIALDEHLVVGGLPVGYMQFIEIAREVDKENARLLVFDEPTAVLTETEASELLRTMKQLSARGIAQLFITHRLEEVLEVANRITVLRDGELVQTLDRRDATVERLAELMIGRAIPDRDRGERASRAGEIVLRVRDLHVEMPGEELHGVDLDVREGEILGLAGLAGQGKTAVANGIMGLFPARGEVRFRGETLPLGQPLQALRRRIGFVSEDRRQVGLLLDESIEFNIAATAIQVQHRFLRGIGKLGWYDVAAARAHALAQIEELDIRCQGPQQPVRRLSGGNQQKVCLARALTLKPDLLFVSEPTRGIDVGAKDRVLQLLVERNREDGITIVLASSELAELRRICDRIAVIDRGRVAGILAPDAPDVEFGLLFAGESRRRADPGPETQPSTERWPS